MNAEGTNQFSAPRRPTLCWECANANCGCSWSQSFKPVEGWVAIPTYSKVFRSYIVIECPEFDRDSTNNGLKRIKRRNEK